MAKPVAVNIDCNFEYSFERRCLSAAGIELREQRCQNEEEILRACAEADAVLVEGTKTPLTGAVLEKLPKCRLVAKYAVGVDNIDVAAATRLGIVVANAADYCTEEVSDHAAGLVLACARRIVALDRYVQAGHWAGAARTVPVRRMRRTTLGLLGLGRIAQALAKKMSGFEMRILGTDPYLPAEVQIPGVERVSLETLVAESDFVSVHVPLSAGTRGLVSAAVLRQMRPTSFLINTSRGPVVDEPALIHALQEKWIAGAALDVVEQEPLAASSPLRGMPNVILTPHTAADSVDSLQHCRETVVRSAIAGLTGYWPPFPVNPAVQPRVALRPWREAPPLSL